MCNFVRLLVLLKVNEARKPSARRSLRRPANSSRADIPAFSMSSSEGVPVGPGGGFVVERVGLQAPMQNADESVAELS
jgi:hypothetical protein